MAENEKSLQYIYETMELDVPQKEVDISEYKDVEALSEHSANERMGAALRVFIQSVLDSAASIEKIDKTVIDAQIAAIDEKISAQLDEIIQKLESSWRSLKFLVDRTNFRKNIKLELLNVSKNDLLEDFEDSPETTQSGLYKHIYTSEYDTPGGEPLTSMISNYEFDSGAQDISLLQDVSRVAASAHCPFIGSVGTKFFGKNDITELPQIEDLENYMDRAEYLKWKSFRESEDSRYVGLTLPRFLLRQPYGEDNKVKEFNYTEKVTGEEHEKYLWGNASFAFATNMTRSFEDNGWCVQIRGPEAGGKVEDLPIHTFDVGRGNQVKIP
ncbi:type VI secretion system contractile sheath large subunit, partial [Fibrobacterota bacterium]